MITTDAYQLTTALCVVLAINVIAIMLNVIVYFMAKAATRDAQVLLDKACKKWTTGE